MAARPTTRWCRMSSSATVRSGSVDSAARSAHQLSAGLRCDSGAATRSVLATAGAGASSTGRLEGAEPWPSR